MMIFGENSSTFIVQIWVGKYQAASKAEERKPQKYVFEKIAEWLEPPPTHLLTSWVH